MKRILFVAILLGLVAVSCDTDKMKKGQMANFSFEYPSSYTISETADEYPESASFSIEHKDKGYQGIYSILYYTPEEIEEHLAHRMDEFLESKLMDLFNYFDQHSDTYPIDDVSDVMPYEGPVQGNGIYIYGTQESNGEPYEACVLNYFEGNALVSALMIAGDEESLEELISVANSITFEEE